MKKHTVELFSDNYKIEGNIDGMLTATLGLAVDANMRNLADWADGWAKDSAGESEQTLAELLNRISKVRAVFEESKSNTFSLVGEATGKEVFVLLHILVFEFAKTTKDLKNEVMKKMISS